MQEIGALEAENTFGALLDLVERGEEILIIRHGKPIAKLVPSVGAFDREQAKAAVKRIRARAQNLKFGPFDWECLKAERDNGRP